MTTPDYPVRETAPADQPEAAYAALRAEGIRLLQQLSHETWTDYNTHDPGVTILELLCYAVTDLIYRTGFATADYLTDASGRIDLDQLALYPPERIFPSPAVTVSDYRKLIFDAIPEIEHVWMEPIAGGLYRIYLQLATSDAALNASEQAAREARVIAHVRREYAMHRNLCEDLASVEVRTPRAYTVHGTIQIGDTPPSTDLLGELYVRALQVVNGTQHHRSYADELARGRSPADVFNGPRTQHVHVADEDLQQHRTMVHTSDVRQELGAVPGVRRVDELWFQDPENPQPHLLYVLPCDSESGFGPRLQLPASPDEMHLVLRNGDLQLSVPFAEVDRAIKRRLARDRYARVASSTDADRPQQPIGEFRDLHAYYSIQNDFPATYGVSRFGLPESTLAHRRAQASNLKAYLMLFEQPMADFLEQLQQLPQLFSREPSQRTSHFHQELMDAEVPGIASLYPAGALDRIAVLLGTDDTYSDRRNRILDYLLGLYGHTFSREALYGIERYGVSIDDELIRGKVELLRFLGDSEYETRATS